MRVIYFVILIKNKRKNETIFIKMLSKSININNDRKDYLLLGTGFIL